MASVGPVHHRVLPTGIKSTKVKLSYYLRTGTTSSGCLRSMAMDYVSFMRRVDGKPPKAEPKVDTSGFYYSESYPPNLTVIRAVLEGDYREISGAFTWMHTPQGRGYWDDIDDGTSQLTAADVQYLEWLLREYS
jgi:hypothetical protein